MPVLSQLVINFLNLHMSSKQVKRLPDNLNNIKDFKNTLTNVICLIFNFLTWLWQRHLSVGNEITINHNFSLRYFDIKGIYEYYLICSSKNILRCGCSTWLMILEICPLICCQEYGGYT